jgi:hypothetical protein
LGIQVPVVPECSCMKEASSHSLGPSKFQTNKAVVLKKP